MKPRPRPTAKRTSALDYSSNNPTGASSSSAASTAPIFSSSVTTASSSPSISQQQRRRHHGEDWWPSNAFMLLMEMLEIHEVVRCRAVCASWAEKCEWPVLWQRLVMRDVGKQLRPYVDLDSVFLHFAVPWCDKLPATFSGGSYERAVQRLKRHFFCDGRKLHAVCVMMSRLPHISALISTVASYAVGEQNHNSNNHSSSSRDDGDCKAAATRKTFREMLGTVQTWCTLPNYGLFEELFAIHTTLCGDAEVSGDTNNSSDNKSKPKLLTIENFTDWAATIPPAPPPQRGGAGMRRRRQPPQPAPKLPSTASIANTFQFTAITATVLEPANQVYKEAGPWSVPHHCVVDFLVIAPLLFGHLDDTTRRHLFELEIMQESSRITSLSVADSLAEGKLLAAVFCFSFSCIFVVMQHLVSLVFAYSFGMISPLVWVYRLVVPPFLRLAITLQRFPIPDAHWNIVVPLDHYADANVSDSANLSSNSSSNISTIEGVLLAAANNISGNLTLIDALQNSGDASFFDTAFAFVTLPVTFAFSIVQTVLHRIGWLVDLIAVDLFGYDTNVEIDRQTQAVASDIPEFPWILTATVVVIVVVLQIVIHFRVYRHPDATPSVARIPNHLRSPLRDIVIYALAGVGFTSLISFVFITPGCAVVTSRFIADFAPFFSSHRVCQLQGQVAAMWVMLFLLTIGVIKNLDDAIFPADQMKPSQRLQKQLAGSGISRTSTMLSRLATAARSLIPLKGEEELAAKRDAVVRQWWWLMWLQHVAQSLLLLRLILGGQYFFVAIGCVAVCVGLQNAVDWVLGS